MSPASCMENQCKGGFCQPPNQTGPGPGTVPGPVPVPVSGTSSGACPAVTIAMPASLQHQLPPPMTRTGSVGGGGAGGHGGTAGTAGAAAAAGGATNASRRTSLWVETLRQTRKLSYASDRPILVSAHT
ncbi:hypothetical protein ACLKA7_005717 [Drosophila subpalustris]